MAPSRPLPSGNASVHCSAGCRYQSRVPPAGSRDSLADAASCHLPTAIAPNATPLFSAVRRVTIRTSVTIPYPKCVLAAGAAVLRDHGRIDVGEAVGGLVG